MKRWTGYAALVFVLSGHTARAQDLVRLFSWDEMHEEKRVVGGEFIDGLQKEPGTLKVSHAGPGPATITILEMDDIDMLDVKKANYSIIARVRHEDVEGTGYLELWSHYPGGQRSVTRTWATEGRGKSLTGTANWRDMELPTRSAFKPTKLVLNVVFAGKGTVYLGPVALEQYKASEAWWDDSMGGWLGGIGGSVVGILGALIGTLTSLGRGRPVVFALLALVILGGVAGLVAAIIALIQGQPYGVWYPLMLGGAIATPLGIFLWPSIRKKFEMAELQRMQAMDVKGTTKQPSQA